MYFDELVEFICTRVEIFMLRLRIIRLKRSEIGMYRILKKEETCFSTLSSVLSEIEFFLFL